MRPTPGTRADRAKTKAALDRAVRAGAQSRARRGAVAMKTVIKKAAYDALACSSIRLEVLHGPWA